MQAEGLPFMLNLVLLHMLHRCNATLPQADHVGNTVLANTQDLHVLVVNPMTC